MPLALPPAPPSLGAPANAPVPTLVRHDDAAARDFAALLGAMLTPTHADATRPAVKLTLDALADAAVADAEAADAPLADADAADAAATGIDEQEPTPSRGETRSSETRSAATRTIDAAIARRRAAAAAQAAARTIMDESTGAARDAITGRTDASANTNAIGATGAAWMTAKAPLVADTDPLDADFSARLERVIDRMRKAGHTVEVRETLRSPERQQALYAQGRTAGGPVVTWTLDSRHIEGKAADVRVDGSASGRAYDLLHAIAEEEGLRTLGARDPGHLELPRTTADAREGAAARRGAGAFGLGTDARAGTITATVVAPGGIARVARIADVAAVAQVATPGMRTAGAARAATTDVAAAGAGTNGRANGAANATDAGRRTAAARGAMRAPALPALPLAEGSVVRVAKVESAAATLGPDATQHAIATRDAATTTVPADESAAAPGTMPVPTGRATQQGAGSQGAGSQGSGSQDASAQEQDEARTARPTRARTNGLGVGDAMPRLGAESTHAMPAAHARHGAVGAATHITAPGSLAAERVADLLAARDAQPAGTLGELRLTMDPARDGLSEVRLAMQHGALDATLRTADAGVARGLQAEVATLTRSLERQGFDAARVTVQLDAAQQARSAALDTVAAAEATARERGLRGDSDAAREGRDQHMPRQQTAHDDQRDRQFARQFAPRRSRTS